MSDIWGANKEAKTLTLNLWLIAACWIMSRLRKPSVTDPPYSLIGYPMMT